MVKDLDYAEKSIVHYEEQLLANKMKTLLLGKVWNFVEFFKVVLDYVFRRTKFLCKSKAAEPSGNYAQLDGDS